MRQNASRAVLVALAIAIASLARAEEARTKVRWLGHSAFEIVSPGGKTILVDPWIQGNPQAPLKLEEISKADLVLVTHDHFDHLGDAVAIVKKTGGVLVGSYELLQRLVKEGLPEKNALNGGYGMSIGGKALVAGITVTMVQAVHSGDPSGYVITLENGKRVYYAGDTGIFGDMKLIADLYPLDLAILPIGDTFTMGAFQAAEALKLLRPKAAIPMHYGSFPMLAKDASEFVKLSQKTAPKVKVAVVKPGEEYRF